ncbi:hypothetical protein V6N11_032270 [Hibiscus sabdariffa]|uniref:Uncharacterized protein n=1 Tax=Hibiscus sabdariffa TaxID=183260 RepID=A0ABR2T0Y0_9ROSI
MKAYLGIACFSDDDKSEGCRKMGHPEVGCQPIVPPTFTFVYYLFALQWPPSICDSYIRCREGIPTDFTIHGLWPQNGRNRGVPPYNTNGNCTTLTVIDPYIAMRRVQRARLEGPLTQVWPNLRNTSNIYLHQRFWRHEWRDHGMCSDYGDDPIRYFRAAIDLRNYLVSVLNFNGGVASKAIDISTNVQAQVGKIPQIHCIRSRTTNNDLLGEIRFCYNKGDATPSGIRDCARHYSGTCTTGQEYIEIL